MGDFYRGILIGGLLKGDFYRGIFFKGSFYSFFYRGIFIGRFLWEKVAGWDFLFID